MNEMKTIKIISTPTASKETSFGIGSGEKFREQLVDLIGLELPIIGVEDPNSASSIWHKIKDEDTRYEVSPKEIIEALKRAGKTKAAEFFSRYINSSNFFFNKKDCEIVE
jgi:hypothetical protein